MNGKGKKLCFYIIEVFLVNICFFSFNSYALAANHKIVIEGVKCNAKDASGNDLDMSDPEVALEVYSSCLASYTENTAPTEYKLTNGSKVAPGSYAMFFVKYIHNDGDSNALSFSTFTNYDSSVWSLASIDGTDIVFPGKSIDNPSEGFPGKKSLGKLKVTWSVQANSPKAGDVRFYGDDATTNRALLSEDVILGHFFVKMNDNAPANSTTAFSFANGTMLGDDNNQTITGTIVEGLSLSVAGAAASSDASLKTLTVKGNNISYPLNPTLVPGSLTPNEFNVIVPANVTTINVTADANDSNATVSTMTLNGGSISSNLNFGDNTVVITVTSQDPGVVQTYTINVKRLSNVATLNGISFTNGISISGFSSGTKSYTINNVPYATKNTNITATLTDSNASIKSGDGAWSLTNHGSTVNKRDIVVEAENCKTEYASVTGNSCTKETYTINLNRIAPSNNSFLSSLSVNGTSVPSFNKNTKTYTVNVPNNTTSVNVLGVVEDTGKANVTSGNGSHNINVGDNTINVVVTAENLSTTTYTITVHRKNNDATLSSLTVSSNPSGTLSPIFTSSFPGDYTYSYGPTVTTLNVSATATDTNFATVSLTDTTNGAQGIAGTSSTASASYGITTKSVAALVTAEDGTIKTYSVNFARAQSSNNDLSDLKIDGTTVTGFKKETKTYNVEVQSTVSSINITAIPDDANATIISGDGVKTLNFGNNSYEIIVEAENKQRSSYFLNVKRKESSDATLSSLTVDGVAITGFSPTTYIYNLDKVPFTKTSINIGAVLSDSNARIVSGTGNINLNTGINALKVVVNAQDGTPQTYTINIERAKNQDATVKSVVVKGVTASINGEGKYVVTLPNSADVITPSDVVIGISNDATLTKPQTNMNLSTTAVNSYTFTVTAEDTNVVETYEILITRTKSDDKSVGLVTLTLADSTTKTCTMIGDSCTIEVPADTTGFNLSASISSTASINPLNGTYHTMANNESIKPITLVVTAEDSTTKTYTVNVERQKSSNNYLRDLTVDGRTVDGFSADKTVYDITVPGLTSQITVGATVEDTGKANIKTDLSSPFSLNFGTGNRISIEVEAENKQLKTYTLNITRELGIDATLSDLTVNGTTVAGFDPDTEDYTLSDVDYNTVAINIGATTNDSLANATGTGNITINTGDNILKVLVTAHDGKTKKEYRIHVNRAKNRDTGIKGITVAGVSAVKGTGNTYTVTVPNNVTIADSTNTVVAVNDPKLPTDPLATYTVTPTNLSTKNDNNVVIMVTSEDGNPESYNLIVTREKSNVATLDSLTVTGGSFSPSFKKDEFNYTVTVPVDTTSFNVDADKTDSESIINSGIGSYTMSASTMKVEVVVVSEDEKVTNKYVLNIERTKSSVNTLDSLTVSYQGAEQTLSPTFSYDHTLYTVNVTGDVDNVDVAGSLSDDRAKIESGAGNYPLRVGTNTITVRVRSESGSPLDYVITVIRAPKSDVKLTDLTIDGDTVPSFDPEILEYTIDSHYPYTKTSISIGATLSDRDASVTGTGTKGLKTGENTFEVVVTAEDNTTTKTYKIKVTREKNDNKNLSILSVNGAVLTPSFDAKVTDYEITVPETKAELLPEDVTAFPDDTNATVAKGPKLPLSTTDDNYYVITVTAENGTTKQYTIKVIRPKSTDATLKNVELNGASLSPTFSPSRDTYTLNVPYGATSFEITGIPNVDTTQVSGNGTYNVADYSQIQLTTLPEAGAGYVKTYTFNIVEALSNDATLTSLGVAGYPFKDATFNSAITTYNIGNIPYGITEVLINADATNPAATIEYYVDGVKQDSNRVNIPQVVGSKTITVKVTAADGIAYKDYIINYNMVLSDNAYLRELTPSVGNIDFNKTEYGYELNVSNDVNSIDFDIATEDNNARITVDGNVYPTPKKITLNNLQVGNTTLSILVTAQDGVSKKTYSVVIKKAAPVASNDATLSDLEVVDYPFATAFDSETEDYTIGTIPYNVENLTIRATAKIGASKIKYFVNDQVQSSNIVNVPKQNGTGEIRIEVTAEDGLTVKNYRIAYSKTASNNAYLSNINLSEGNISFVKTKQDYTIDVDATVDSIDIELIAEQSGATISVDGNSHISPYTYTLTPLSTGTNNVNVVVTAEDGTTLTYTLAFNKGTGVSEKITSDIYGHLIESGFIKTVKIETTASEIKDQLDNANEYLEIWDADETAKIEDGQKLGTGMIVKLMINGEEKDRKIIVVLGDANGDGAITTFDAVLTSNHFLEFGELVGAYAIAADANKDNNITTFDAVLISNHFLEFGNLFE